MLYVGDHGAAGFAPPADNCMRGDTDNAFAGTTRVALSSHFNERFGEPESTKDRMRRSIQLRPRWAALGMLVLGLAITAPAQEGRKLIAQPAPAYPEVARRARLSGTVKVQVSIAADGSVKDVKVIGGHPLFVDATIEALKKWKYVPSNAEVTVALELNFHP
jgi:TonB family protein